MARLGRRGRRSDPTWANRRLLVRALERISAKAFTRMSNTSADNDPSNQLISAWIAKDELRALRLPRQSPARNLSSAVAILRLVRQADRPEVTALAETVTAWWPEIETFLSLITNAATEERTE